MLYEVTGACCYRLLSSGVISYAILQENITFLSVIEMNRKAKEKSLEVYVVSSLVDAVVGVSVKFLLVAPPLYWMSNHINLKIEPDVGGLKRDEKMWKGEPPRGGGIWHHHEMTPLVPLANKTQFNAPDLIFTSAAHKYHQI